MYNHAMTSIRVYSRLREEIIDITPQVQRFVAASGHRSGLVAIYCPHTTAAISVNENAKGNEDAHIQAVVIPG